MTRDEQYTYIFLLFFMLIFIIWIVPNQIVAGENASVSPRTVPLICAGIIAFISALQLGRSVVGHQVVRQELAIGRANYRILLITTIILVAVGMLMNQLPTVYVSGVPVGRFWLGSIVMIPALLVLGRVTSWWRIALYTVCLIVATFFLAQIAGIYIS